MNITEERLDEQNARIKIKVEPEDYQEQYNKALRQYKSQINMPGFRTGKVPLGLVKKKYGRSLLSEQLNKVVSDNIQTYVAENDLNILGGPLPSETHGERGNWDNPEEFEFVYDLGLAPELSISITKSDTFDYFTIEITDQMIDEHIAAIARRYGKMSSGSEVGKQDIVTGDFVELQHDGEIKPAGIFYESEFSLETLSADVAERLYGMKAGDVIEIDPRTIAPDTGRLARLLDVEPELVANLSERFKFTLNEIKQLEPAVLDQSLFDKVFGEGAVADEASFRSKISDQLKENFKADSDRLFLRDLSRKLIDQYHPSLPDAFLKKWIMLTSEDPIQPEELELSYDSYKQGMQWELILNHLRSNDQLQVEKSEMLDRVKMLLTNQYEQYGLPAPDDADLTKNSLAVLSKEEEAKKIATMLYDEKLLSFTFEHATISKKEVAYDAFVQLAQKTGKN